MESKPKDVGSGLRGEPDAHWNLILPQIKFSKVVSIDSLKLTMGGTLHIYTRIKNKSLCSIMFNTEHREPTSLAITHVAHRMFNSSLIKPLQNSQLTSRAAVLIALLNTYMGSNATESIAL